MTYNQQLDAKINAAAAGQSVGITIYWEPQSHGQAYVGPAYRFDDGRAFGSLKLVCWSSHDGTEGYHLQDFFDAEGRYLGVDQDGVYPTFELI